MKTYMQAIPLVVSRQALMIAQVKSVTAWFNPRGPLWYDYRNFINLAECEELPGKRKRILVEIAPLSFHERITFPVGEYDGVMVGTRVYHGGKEYRSGYTTDPVILDPNDSLCVMLDLSECMD